MRAVRRELGPTRIRRLAFGQRRGERWLWIDAGTSLRGQWEASLLADLYAAAAAREGLRGPAEVMIGGSGHRPAGVRPAAGAVRVARVRRLLRAGGARLVGVARPAGTLALTLRTRDPGRFLPRYGQRFVATIHGGSVYFAVEDAQGSIVHAAGWLPDEEMMFARPDLDACGPVLHSLPLGASEPPCPG